MNENSYYLTPSGEKILDDAYELFLNNIYTTLDSGEKTFKDITINGKRVFIDMNKEIEGKSLTFWHLASQGTSETKYDMFPCENHLAKAECTTKCDYLSQNNFLSDYNRIPCIYRAEKISYLFKTINVYNQNNKDSRIKYWTIKEDDCKHLKIRYTDKFMDYIVIFKIQYKPDKTDISQYRLITSYPIVLKSYARRFNREYNNYLQHKRK